MNGEVPGQGPKNKKRKTIPIVDDAQEAILRSLDEESHDMCHDFFLEDGE